MRFFSLARPLQPSRFSLTKKALVLGTVVALGATGFGAVASASDTGIGSDTAQSSGATVAGGNVTIKAHFPAAPSSGQFVLDTEIYQGSNRVAQFYDQPQLNTGDKTERSYSWNTAGLSDGTYRVAMGVFYQNWSGLVSWNDNSGSIKLTKPVFKATAPATSAAPGSQVSINTTFKVPAGLSAANRVYDVEVWSTSGNRVAQSFQTQGAGGGASVVIPISFGAPGAGSYRVAAGVFAENWSSLEYWNDKAGALNIGTAAAPTTTPVVPTTIPSGSGNSSTPTSMPAPGPVPAPTTTTTAAPKPTTTTTAAPKPTPTTTVVTPVTPAPSSSNPLAGVSFYGPNPGAASQAQAYGTSTANGQLMLRLSQVPAAQWMGAWSGDIKSAVNNLVTTAASQNKSAVLVAYNIPNRDCGGFSAGGAQDEATYDAWMDQFAAGLNHRKTVVVVEPDALALDCGQDLTPRYRMINHAIDDLNAQGAVVYLDAGHANWVNPTDMANRLKAAGVAKARGFAINTSNFDATASEITYGDQVVGASGLNIHYVIDTSRNGNGSDGNWCNPSGRALGATPTTNTASSHADAYLWLKVPGESDGNCNGGPNAGDWFGSYALGLAQSAWGH